METMELVRKGPGKRRAASSKSTVSKKKTARQEKAPKLSRGQRRARRTTQAILQYDALTEAGICDLGEGRYSLTLALSDIDYQVAPELVQQYVVENYARLLNSFDADQCVQVSVVNRFVDKDAIAADVELATCGDGLDAYRLSLNGVIEDKLSRGRNNTVTDKFLTVTITADSYEAAQQMLARVEAETAAQLRQMGGCKAERLSGEGRVRLLQSILRPGSPNNFSYEAMIGSNLTTKDAVAPWQMDFKTDSQRAISLGTADDDFVQVLCLRDLPRWLSDRLIRDITEINSDLVLSIHYRPLEQVEGLELVKRQIAGMEMQTIREQEKARKRGYSEELISHELKASMHEAQELLRQLEQSNEKLFSMTLVVAVRGKSLQDLSEQVERVRTAARKQSCTLEDLRYMQEDGLNAALPLGWSRLPIFRTVTTATAAILVPFTTQEILDPGGLYYGVNRTSKNLIVGSRAETMNGNAFFLGTTGSGKSQYAKKELTQVVLNRSDDDVIIIDPEWEYWALGEALGATRIEIGADSRHSLNPLAISRDEGMEEGSPIKRKAEFILSMCEVLVGGSMGLSPAERSVIDRCATAMYNTYWRDKKAPMPTMATFYDQLLAENDEAARGVATALELYAKGSFSGFAQQTNVDTTNRFTIYDISTLGSELKTFGMLVVLEAIWSRVRENRAQGKRTWVYIDEFHLLFDNPYAADFCQAFYKRARKWGAFPTGITQNIDELLASPEARLMLANSAMLALLNQNPTDADELQSLFKLSDKQRETITNLEPGCGILKMGSAMVPFDDRIGTDTELYQLFTTKFGEAVNVETVSL